MTMDTNSQGALYCTFKEQDLKNHFSMGFEDFLKNREAVERFSEILMLKSKEQSGIDIMDGEVDVIIYQTGETDYAISIQKYERMAKMPEMGTLSESNGENVKCSVILSVKRKGREKDVQTKGK